MSPSGRKTPRLSTLTRESIKPFCCSESTLPPVDLQVIKAAVAAKWIKPGTWCTPTLTMSTCLEHLVSYSNPCVNLPFPGSHEPGPAPCSLMLYFISALTKEENEH